MRIASKRNLVQWLSTLLLLFVPFLTLDGESLIRLDAATRTILFFGARIRIEEFYLFLIVVLIAVFVFLFVTLMFGRVWCGWLCPQTTVNDLAAWIDGKAASFAGKGVTAGVLRHLCYAVLSFTVAANLVWYFIPPREFFQRLFSGAIGPVAGISLAVTFVVIYLDLTLVRGAFCRLVCPYGRIQHLTMDANTLTLEFNPERRAQCLRCGACTRVCPMGIDIREGLQIECINCGRCLDACRGVMEKRGTLGLIRYAFGPGNAGTPYNLRSFATAALIVVLCALLSFGIATRKGATVKVERAGNGEVRTLLDGSLVNFFSAYVENRSTRPGRFTLALTPQSGMRCELVGPVYDIALEPNANRKVNFALKVAPPTAGAHDLKLQLLRDGKPVDATLLPVLVK